MEAVCSIDEIACRLTGSQKLETNARALSEKIKATIRAHVGSSLRCSIGIAPNRYLAKIAADMKKPDGFTLLRRNQLPNVLYPLNLRDLPGIGPQTESKLISRGIGSMKTLCSMTEQDMMNVWGSVSGGELWYLLRGYDLQRDEVERKTISQSHVLPPELRHSDGALRVLKKLVTQAAFRLRKEALWASQLQVFVKYLGQDTWKARCGIIETQDTIEFIRAITRIWNDVPAGSFYAVGVVLSGLVPDSLHAPTLFEDPRRQQLTRTLDQLNEKFGRDAVHWSAL